MKFAGLLFIILFSIFAFAESLPRQITIGFTPGGDTETLKKGSTLIAEALQKELKIPIKVFISPDYSSLLLAMKEKTVDFGFLTARTFVEGETEYGIKVLLKKIWAEPYYYSVVLTKKNSKIKKLEDLKGRRVAFVDEKSTSGYLYPQVEIHKKKMKDSDFKEMRFSGSHSVSVELLENNQVDAIAVFSDDPSGSKSAWTKYSKAKNPLKDIRVLWVSEPIPNDPFCVRKDFYDQYPKLTHALMFTLIDAADLLKMNENVKEIVGAKGFLPATSRHYDSVRNMVSSLKEQKK